jgi:RimJ/RimL family protein N-acetyltransferase
MNGRGAETGSGSGPGGSSRGASGFEARVALRIGTLEDATVRLEPLGLGHVAGLAAAAAESPAEYQLAPVPTDSEGMRAYVLQALAEAEAGRSVPFAIVDLRAGARAGEDPGAGPSQARAPRVVGSTRLMSLEWWTWPPRPIQVDGEPRLASAGHPPDVAELGSVWLAASVLRTAVNTAACVLLMTHAFESWRVHRLTLKTDARNLRSRAAILRLGGQFEGILRAHLPAADGQIRDTAMFSVVRSEWPELKPRLEAELRRGPSGKEDAR